jgi:hypothetical protein
MEVDEELRREGVERSIYQTRGNIRLATTRGNTPIWKRLLELAESYPDARLIDIEGSIWS